MLLNDLLLFLFLNFFCRYERQRMTIEGQSGNIGATAFAVSNIETQKQIVWKYLQQISFSKLLIYIIFQFTGLKDAKKQLTKGYKDLKPEKVEVSFINDYNIVFIFEKKRKKKKKKTFVFNRWVTNRFDESNHQNKNEKSVVDSFIGKNKSTKLALQHSKLKNKTCPRFALRLYK